MKTIHVGVIGLGFIGKLHVDALRRIPGVTIVAISSAVKEEMESVGNAYAIEKRYASWEDLIDDPKVEAVHDCAPVSLHEAINSRCILRGKAIYSEKPLAMDSADAKRQIALLEQHPVPNLVGHQYRSNAAVHAMKELLEKGTCGTLLFIRARYFQESLCKQSDYTSRLVPENSPARALSDLGSHLADLIDYLTGSTIAKVNATMITHYAERTPLSQAPVPIHSDDTTLAQFVTEKGVFGLFAVSKCAQGHKNDLEIALECSECELIWNQQQPDRYQMNRRESGNALVYVDPKYCSPSVKPLVSLPVGHVMGWADALRNNMQLFYASIQQGTWKADVPYTTFHDELSVQEFLDSAMQSSREQRWVEVKR